MLSFMLVSMGITEDRNSQNLSAGVRKHKEEHLLMEMSYCNTLTHSSYLQQHICNLLIVILSLHYIAT